MKKELTGWITDGYGGIEIYGTKERMVDCEMEPDDYLSFLIDEFLGKKVKITVEAIE